MTEHQIIYICGVCGSGKTTVGHALSRKTGIPFFDGDDFHPQRNVAKMRTGEPLDDDDRKGWLESIHRFAVERVQSASLIIACSALKEEYRQSLMRSCATQCRWVYLEGSFELIKGRLEQRKMHFMPVNLLQSQFDTLEEPAYALRVDISLALDSIVNTIENYLKIDVLT